MACGPSHGSHGKTVHYYLPTAVGIRNDVAIRIMESQDRREEASGPGWQEHFVVSDQASATVSVGSAVAKCMSYITIANFATLEERCVLHESALEVQNNGASGSHVLFASATNYNCRRYSVEATLNAKAKAVSSAFMERLLGILEGNSNHTDGTQDSSELKNIAHQIFGVSSNLAGMKAVWYAEPDNHGKLQPEPKINLYEEGGFFKQHADGMDLTLLVVLTDSFEGGGTAFYRDDNCIKRSNWDENDSPFEPDSIAKPPAGTAIIWGATLQHMALPVKKGKRAVYVGSFDLKDNA